MSISASLCRDQCTDRNTSGRVTAVADEPHDVLRLGQSESTKTGARCEKLSKVKRRILATVDLPWRKSRKNRLEQGSDRRTFIFGDTWIPLGPITKCRKPKINLTFVPTAEDYLDPLSCFDRIPACDREEDSGHILCLKKYHHHFICE